MEIHIFKVLRSFRFESKRSNIALNCIWFACEWLGSWKSSLFIITFSYNSTIPFGFLLWIYVWIGFFERDFNLLCMCQSQWESIACGVNQSICANWNQSALYYRYTTQPHTHLVMSWVRLQATIAFICQTCLLLKHP